MEIDRIDHQLLDATGEDRPIIKERIIERNLFNYLIFSDKLKLRLTPIMLDKPIPDLRLRIQTQVGQIDGENECIVKTDNLGAVELLYEPEVGLQDRILITPIYDDIEMKSVIIIFYCTLVKQPVKKNYDIEAGKDFLQYLNERIRDLRLLAQELEKKESEFTEQIEREALLKEYNWAVNIMKQLMNDLSVCIGIIEEQKNKIDEMIKNNMELTHNLSDETFLRVQDKAALEAIIKEQKKKIMYLEEEIQEKEEEIVKLADAQEEIVKGQEAMKGHIDTVRTLYDEAIDYLKPPKDMKIKVKTPKEKDDEE
jgi:hypothetical protein